jgi:putative ABC transport system ATP-binding protein
MQIAVNQLTLRYQNHTLFENLSFSADSGQRLCISGPSGMGKSSLLKALMGFVRPAEGTVAIDGTRMTEKTCWKLRRHMAYVPQEPDLGSEPVYERLRQPFSIRANSHLAFDPAKMERLWDRFGLERKLLDRNAAELSGGEKQRAAIIIALLLQRPILLLDEPVSAMDRQSRQVLREVLSEQTDKTVVFISHDESLLDMAEKVIELQRSGGAK